MAQAPQKPAAPPVTHESKPPEASVAMPGIPPQPNMAAPEESKPVSDATAAEQEVGRKVSDEFHKRLEAEQAAGRKLVERAAMMRRPQAQPQAPQPQGQPQHTSTHKPNPLHG